MSVFALIGVSMLAAAVAILVVCVVLLLVRGLPLKTKIKKLQQHPLLLTLQRAQAFSERSADLSAHIALMQPRIAAIVRQAALLLATSALLRGDMEKISRATIDLLDAFIPALRGSL